MKRGKKEKEKEKENEKEKNKCLYQLWLLFVGFVIK